MSRSTNRSMHELRSRNLAKEIRTPSRKRAAMYKRRKLIGGCEQYGERMYQIFSELIEL
jgi:hypothetical protein